ncbi:MAG: tetratricopeptide repeat protein [bacterium]|nr:tetratricopeptide repeat protein [bacterium]
MNNQGIELGNNGDHEKAREYLEKAYNLAPDNKIIKQNLINAYATLAYQAEEKNDWISSITFREKTYLLDKTNPRLAKNLAIAHNNYAIGLMNKKDYETAFTHFHQAAKLDNENWSVFVNLGNLMYLQGKNEDAVTYWNKALELHPDLPEIRNKVTALEKENKVGEKFNRQGFSRFEVKYEGFARQDLAGKALLMLNDAYYKIGSDFNYFPKEKVTIVIYNKGQYGEVTGNPDWLPGQAEGNGTIRLTADDIENSEERLKNVLYHEYTHVLLYRKMGMKIPRWLDEGLAQYKEPSGGDKLSEEELTILKKHLAQGDLISLSNLDSSWDTNRDQETTSLAYYEAKALILYLVDRYTMYQVSTILDKYKASKDINQALKDALYLDSSQVEQSWLAWLKGKY